MEIENRACQFCHWHVVSGRRGVIAALSEQTDAHCRSLSNAFGTALRVISSSCWFWHVWNLTTFYIETVWLWLLAFREMVWKKGLVPSNEFTHEWHRCDIRIRKTFQRKQREHAFVKPLFLAGSVSGNFKTHATLRKHNIRSRERALVHKNAAVLNYRVKQGTDILSWAFIYQPSAFRRASGRGSWMQKNIHKTRWQAGGLPLRLCYFFFSVSVLLLSCLLPYTCSPNSVATLRGSYGQKKARCSIEVVALVCGIFPVNYRTKLLLWNVHVRFDCAGSHKTWAAGSGSGIFSLNFPTKSLL